MSLFFATLAACTAARDGGAELEAPQTRCWDIACDSYASSGCSDDYGTFCRTVCGAEFYCGGGRCQADCGRTPSDPSGGGGMAPDASVADCTDTCGYANDGVCDEPTYCEPGTDCTDCGDGSGSGGGGGGCTPSCAPGSCGSDGCGDRCRCTFGTSCNNSTNRCEDMGYCYTASCGGDERDYCFEDLSSYCAGFCVDVRSGSCSPVFGPYSCTCL